MTTPLGVPTEAFHKWNKRMLDLFHKGYGDRYTDQVADDVMEALDEYAQAAHDNGRREADAEIERLRALLEQVDGGGLACLDASQRERNAAEARVAQLEAALRHYADHPDSRCRSMPDGSCVTMHQLYASVGIKPVATVEEKT